MDAKNLEITYSFSRLSNGPLDKSSHFDSQDDLENAYTHSTYTDSPFYDGEVVTVSDSTGGTAYVYQNYNGQTHLDPIILNSEFNCSIVSNAAKYIEASNEQALKITNKYADDNAQKIDTSSIVNLKFVGKCTTADINDRTSAFWASTPGNVWFISESFEIDSVPYEAYSHIICIAGPMSTGQTFHDHFSVLGPVDWHGKTIDAYTQDESNTKYMYKENILDNVISQESNTLFGKLNNAVFSSLKTNKTEFNILRNIYGKSLVWNQLVATTGTYPFHGLTLTFNNGTFTLDGVASTTANIYFVTALGCKTLGAGHRGLVYYDYISGSRQSSGNIQIVYTTPTTIILSALENNHIIFSARSNNYPYLLISVNEGDIFDHYTVRYQLFDLTRMFGAGNEPSTVEEFKKLFPNDYYPYNVGEIISNKTEKLEMTGFNKWDEEWEIGIYDSTTGEKKPYLLAIRCKNYISVLPSTYYYFQSPTTSAPYGRVLFYDADYNYIDSTLLDTRAHRLWETPSNCSYITFYMVALYGTTYNHDICINVSDPNKNGTYEPYKHNDLLLNLTTLTGKLNGIGDRVTIFPDGMSSAGNVHDELIVDENGNAKMAIKRVGSVDLGSKSWSLISGLSTTFFREMTDSPRRNTFDVLCHKYMSSSGNHYATLEDKTVIGYGNATPYNFTRLAIRDDSYTNASDFRAANNGVILYYELATPLVYTDLQYADLIDIPFTLPVRYKVDNFGTEEIVVPNSIAGEPTSCAPNITIKYNANTVDQDTFIYRTTGGNTDVESGYAYIEGIQGNEIVWNQLIVNGNFESTTGWLGITLLSGGVATSYKAGTGSSHYQDIARSVALSVTIGHIYLLAASMVSNNANTAIRIQVTNTASVGGSASRYRPTWEWVGYIWTASTASIYPRVRGTNSSGTDIDFSAKEYCIYDLTLMFGAGNEPTTITEFEAWLAQYVGFKNYYPYDAGTLLPMKMKAIRTVGFNQWDEQWEVGGYDNTTGAKKTASTTIRNKEYIPIFPNTTYYCNANNYGGTYTIQLFYYDIDKNFLSYVAVDGTFTTPMDAYYMNFVLRSEYGTTYNHDICINLQKDGSRKGDYEHYWTKEAEFNVMEITGINSNTGQRETIFPNGMCGKGDWADVIYHDGDNTIAIKKTGRVDLGSLTWVDYVAPTSSIPHGYSATSIVGKSNSILNILSSGYMTKSGWTDDKYMRGHGSTRGVYIIDSALQGKTGAQIKSAMSGVYLDYELATPIIYTDLQYVDGRPFNQLWFKTYENGLIYQNPQTPLSVPMNMDYETPYDMPAEYICMDSFDTLLDQLGNSMGGTWTKTYNEETQAYEFRFTVSN